MSWRKYFNSSHTLKGIFGGDKNMTSGFANKHRLALGLTLIVSPPAISDDLALGLMTGLAESPYKETTPRVFPFPFVDYEGDFLFFHGVQGGIHLLKDRVNQFDVFAAYDPRQFRPQDSNDSKIQRLDKRRSTVTTGLEYSLRTYFGHFSASVAHDALNNSDGVFANTSYMYPFALTDWELTPEIGVRWDNKDQNNYYAGISIDESRRSGLPSYTPDDSFTPYIVLSANYHMSNDWKAFFSARYDITADEVKKSPMIDKNGVGIVSTGISYTF